MKLAVFLDAVWAPLAFFSPLHAFERRSPEPGVGGVHPADSVKVPVEDAEAALPSFRPQVSDKRPPVLLRAVYFGRAKPLAAVTATFMRFIFKFNIMNITLNGSAYRRRRSFRRALPRYAKNATWTSRPATSICPWAP